MIFRGTPPKNASAFWWQDGNSYAFGESELDIHHSAVTEHHGEKAEASTGGTHGDGADCPSPPGRISRGELQHQVGGMAQWPDLPDKLLEDAIAAGIALRPQLLDELLCGVGMTFQQRDDPGFKRVQFAGAFGPFAGLIVRSLDPFVDGLEINSSSAASSGLQSLLLVELAQAAVGFV